MLMFLVLVLNFTSLRNLLFGAFLLLCVLLFHLLLLLIFDYIACADTKELGQEYSTYCY